jgi:hypothetical protein
MKDASARFPPPHNKSLLIKRCLAPFGKTKAWKYVAFAAAVGMTGWFGYQFITRNVKFRTWLISRTSKRVDEDVSTTRSIVADIKMPNPKTTPDHTHGRSAGERSAGNMFMHMAATAMGKQPFELSMSRTAQRRGYDGERGQLFWAKDAAVNLTDPYGTRVKDAEMLIVTDVSYYLDNWEDILSDPRPVMEYVFNPTTAGESTADYAFRFMEDGTLSADIAGGGHYGHLLWGVHGDATVCKTYGTGLTGWVLRAIGIPLRATVHCIERYKVGTHTQVVGYFPTLTASFPFSAFLCMLEHTPITRMNPVQDGFVRLIVQSDEGLQVSIARAGRYSSSTIPYDTESQLLDTTELTPDRKITNASVASAIGSSGPESRLWTAYLRQRSYPAQDVRIVDPTRTKSANVAQFLIEDPYDPDAKTMMEPFMNDILMNVGFSHANTRDNEILGIVKRVVEVRSDVKMNGHIYRYALEYIEQLSGGRRHFLHPVDPEDVIATAKNERARRIYEDGDLEEIQNDYLVKSFGKAEMNAELKPMRNITTYPGFQKLSAAPYAQALSKYVGSVQIEHPSGSSHGIYAGGMTPMEIASAITSICMGADFINQSDYSKMDGTISPCLRTFDQMLMCHLFHPQYHNDIRAMLARTHSKTARTRNGVFYQMGTTQGSGCQFTAIIQMLRSDFNIFLASRYQEPEVPPSFAFTRPRLELGDDAVVSDLEPAHLERASKSLGLRVKTALVQRGEMGVNFLSRIYGPLVWFGEPSSCCDVVRAFGNFTRTTKSNLLDPVNKLVTKAFSLWLTDEHTPGVGAFVHTVLRLAATEGVQLRPDADHWWSAWPKLDQYPNENYDGWMLATVPLWVNLTKMDEQCQRATCLSDMLHLEHIGEAQFVRPIETIGVVVNGEQHGPVHPVGDLAQQIATDAREVRVPAANGGPDNAPGQEHGVQPAKTKKPRRRSKKRVQVKSAPPKGRPHLPDAGAKDRPVGRQRRPGRNGGGDGSAPVEDKVVTRPGDGSGSGEV